LEQVSRRDALRSRSHFGDFDDGRYHEAIRRHLPDWLKPHYNKVSWRTLDDDFNVVSISSGSSRATNYRQAQDPPRLRELDIGVATAAHSQGRIRCETSPPCRAVILRQHATRRMLGNAIIERVVGLKALRELSLNTCGTTDVGARRLADMTWLTHFR